MPPKTKGLGSKKGTSKGVTSKKGTSNEGTSKTSTSSILRSQKRFALSDSSNGSESESGNDSTPSQSPSQDLEPQAFAHEIEEEETQPATHETVEEEPQLSAHETEEEDPQPAAPMDVDFFFEPTQYNIGCKIQTRCELSNFLAIMNTDSRARRRFGTKAEEENRTIKGQENSLYGRETQKEDQNRS